MDLDFKDVITDHLTANLADGFLKASLDDIIPGLIGLIIEVILALIAYWIGVKIINAVRKVLRKALKRHDIEEGVCTFLDSLMKLILYIALIIVILGIFGIKSTSIAATVAALGLTAGLSLQGSLSNFAGGVLILVLKPFKVGDYVREDTHGNEGHVTDISIFYTKLLTLDGNTIVVPNGVLANSSMNNYSKIGVRREDIIIGITYDSDIKQAKEILEKLIEENEWVHLDLEHRALVHELASSSVQIDARFWVGVEDYWDAKWDFLEKAKYGLEAAGLVIAFPQMDVHLDMLEKKN